MHAVNVYVRDQERSLRFFLDTLGFQVAFDARVESGQRLVAVAPPNDSIRPGDIVSIHIRPEGVHIFDAESGRRIDPSPQRI